MKQIKSIEWLRGFAAISVTQMHLFCALDFFKKDDYYFYKLLFPISISGRSGVAMFFVISGFIIPYSMYENKYQLSKISQFLIKRFTRLEPPYLFSIIFSLITLSLMWYWCCQPYQIDWTSVSLHLGYLNVFFQKGWIQGVYWTLAIEFQYYLIIALLFPLIMISDIRIRLGILGGIIIVFKLISLRLPIDTFIFEFIEFFSLGILLFLHHINRLSRRTLLVLGVLLLGAIWYFHHKSNTIYALFTAIIIYTNFDIRSKLFYFLGKISYSLYLFHWIIGVEVMRRIYLYYRPISSQFEKIVFVLFSHLVCILFAYLVYMLIEKPSIIWSKNIKY